MANPTFEQAMAQLEQIVAQIESGQVSLEESIAKYEQGTKLVQTCRAMLEAAEQKIQVLTETQSGDVAPAGELPAQEA